MKRLIAVLAAFGLIGVTVFGEAKDPAAATSRHFEIRMQTGNKYDSADFEIQVGDTVTWINEDDKKHSATPDTTSSIQFTETDLASGKFSKRIKFDTAGTVKYHCKHHNAMKGTITVVSAR